MPGGPLILNSTNLPRPVTDGQTDAFLGEIRVFAVRLL